MADISKITLPSGNTYEIKDAVARELIAGGITFDVVWDGTSAPTVANIPAGVVVTYNGTNYTGTKAASTAEPGTFYLVKSGTGTNSYDEYVAANGAWEKLGGKDIDLSNLGALAYKDNVTLTKGSGDVALGEATTFTAAASAVSFSGGTTDKVLGSGATFTTSVTPSTTNIKATASGMAVGASGTDTFVKSYPGATSKLATTTVPNVTSAGAASTWSFAMGSGDDAETLIISGGNGTAPTLGTAKTVATGSLSSTGSGGTVMTGLGTATTGSAVTGVQVTSQPTIALATGATAGTGVVSVATGISSATTTTNNKDEVTAVTGIGTGTAAAQTITVGTNDKITVAKHGDLSVTTS
jgi:hypothetical protein